MYHLQQNKQNNQIYLMIEVIEIKRFHHNFDLIGYFNNVLA